MASSALARTRSMYNLEISDRAVPLLEAVKQFLAQEIEPASKTFHRLGEGRSDRWSFAPEQLEILDDLKNKAKAM